MANLRNIFKSLEDIDREFESHIQRDPVSKCWHWKPKVFRFRHASIIFNPRHYALQMVGYTLEKGRNYTCACLDQRCVNPDHARLKHDGSRPDRDIPLYLDLGIENPKYGKYYGNDFQFSDAHISKKYHISKKEAAQARDRTFKVLQEIKGMQTTMERISNTYKCAPSYVRKIKQMTYDEFRELDEASEAVANLHDESEMNSEALKFVRRAHREFK